MNSNEMRQVLVSYGLAQVEFASLLGITPRAVSLWLKGDREIPGPAMAYLRLYQVLPESLRQTERARLHRRESGFREGIYEISFAGQTSAASATLVFHAGNVYGTDGERTLYDGNYLFDESTGRADLTMKLTVPPDVRSVFDITNPYEWSMDVRARMDPKLDSASIELTSTVHLSIQAHIQFRRALPKTA